MEYKHPLIGHLLVHEEFDKGIVLNIAPDDRSRSFRHEDTKAFFDLWANVYWLNHADTFLIRVGRRWSAERQKWVYVFADTIFAAYTAVWSKEIECVEFKNSSE